MPLAGGFAHGLLMYLSLPPVSLWPVAFAAVAVLIWAGCRTGPAAGVSPRRVSLLFALGTLPWWLAQQVWLLNVTPVGYPLLAVYLAAWTGLTVYLIALLRTCGRPMPMVISAPLAWLACEVLRGEFVLSGYAWFLAGHPLIDAAPLAAPAAMFGAYFVSFLTVALAGSLADAAGWSGVHRRWGGAGAAIVAIAWTLSSMLARSGAEPGEPRGEFRVGVVQTNVPQGQKLAWTAETIATDFRRFMELTRKLIDSQPSPQVIVWPETMFPGISLNDRAAEAYEAYVRANKSLADDERSLNLAMVQMLRRVQGESKIPMLVGSDEVDGARMERLPSGKAAFEFEAKYNSVVLLHDGVISQSRYDKIELTPFGEFIPLAWRWPALQDRVLELGAGGMKFDLAVGRRSEPIVIPGVGPGVRPSRPIAAATPICFEVTRSSLCRRLVYAGGGVRKADVLINLSNDGWFGDIFIPPVPSDAGRAQHLLASRWRCVELGIPMVRAVNTGISGAVDTAGRMLPVEKVEGLATPTRTDGAFIATIPISTRVTIFGRVGNIFAYTFMVLGWLVCGWAWFVGRKTRAISRRRP